MSVRMAWITVDTMGQLGAILCRHVYVVIAEDPSASRPRILGG